MPCSPAPTFGSLAWAGTPLTRSSEPCRYLCPGYSRPMVLVADYLAFVAEHTYADDRVRPIAR